MGRVTQRVDPAALDALLERPPRAAIGFASGGRIEIVPVAYRRSDGRHLVGLAQAAGFAALGAGRAVLLVDDGRFWFELRAVTLRGALFRASAPPPGSGGPPLWLELVPDRTVAWDYGALHEEEDA